MIEWMLILALLVDETQGKPFDAPPAAAKASAGEEGKPPAPVAPAQDSERPFISAAEIKALRETNIFSPKMKKRVYVAPPKPPSGSKNEPPAPRKPKPPVVTGIFFDAKLGAWLVVVEDRNETSLKQFKDPKFLKLGDEVSGYTIGTVTGEKALFLKGEISKELKVGDSLPGEDGKAVSVAPSTEDPEAPPVPPAAAVEIKPLDAAAKNDVLEALKKARGKKSRPSNDE